VKAEGKVGGMRERMRVGARTGLTHRECVCCPAEAEPCAVKKARRSSSALKHTESYHCCPGVEEVDRPANPVSGYRRRCGGEVDLAIACLTEDVEAGFEWVVVEAAVAAAAVERSLVACWTKASRPG
jgi:hypothetical protein